MSDSPDLFELAKAILDRNDRGLYTVPAQHLYPHQWLWDSCFTAFGQRHYDIERAKLEILSLLRAQWSNGMVPHMIFTPGVRASREHGIWSSWLSPFAPDGMATSGISQPPMLAEAVIKIGEKLPLPERRSWYRQVYPNLLAYHQWHYVERDPHSEGLALQIHPWETGLDNNPAWMSELHKHLLPWWIRAARASGLEPFIGFLRRDTRYVPREQRLSNVDAMALYSVQRRLRRKQYDIDKVLNHTLFAIEDLAYNCILIRANTHLQHIARSLRKELPAELAASMEQATRALEELWDPYTEMYYSRDFVTHNLIKEPSIAALLPLYAGTISKERAAVIVKMLENEHIFGVSYPVPSTPLNSPWFDADRYWQGPTWFNANWLIVDGLQRYGFKHHAEALIENSLDLVKDGHFNEYFNPLTGEPLGVKDFSWTAAVTIDWLKR